jgi:hypothetical protein
LVRGGRSRLDWLAASSQPPFHKLDFVVLRLHVDRMEAAGLVERRPDPHDRRARRLYTTAASRALLEPMRARAAAVYEQVLAGMSDAERQALYAGLEAIIANLSAAETAADPSDRRPAERKSA